MNFFHGRQKFLQAFSELIKCSIGVDVFFVDKGMVAQAGTGPYRVNIGTKRPKDSYVDITLNRGDGQVVKEPRYTKQCYRCEFHRLCPYSMVMCQPVTSGERVEGLIGFLGFSEMQRMAMIERYAFLNGLCDKLEDLLEMENPDVRQALIHPKTKTFIDVFEEGLILTSPDYDILHVNQKAEQFLRSEGLIPQIGDRLSNYLKIGSAAGGLEWAASGFLKNKSEIFPISDGRDLVSYLIVVSGREKPPSVWPGCPLHPGRELIGASQAMNHLLEQASFVAESESTVLIQGETGVGKERVARYIHERSRRWSQPFVTVNCAAIPDSLFESELFGYAPGAFTGASKKGKTGKFRQAHGGTIFLDEVGRLSLTNQAKILRILEDGVVQRLGDDRRDTIDVRILAATNIQLEQAVVENRFLQDLYYRLAVIPLYIPPLRERVEDIPLLMEHFVWRFREILPASDHRGFSVQALEHLKRYDWPGNVRELKNMVEYVMNLVRGREVTVRDLPPTLRLPATGKTLPEPGDRPVKPLAEIERDQIRQALLIFGDTTEGKRRAAVHLGISLSTLYRRISQGRKTRQGLNPTRIDPGHNHGHSSGSPANPD